MSGNTEEAEIRLKLSNGEQVGNTLRTVQKQANKLRAEIRDLEPGTQEFIDKSRDLKKVTTAMADINDQVKNVEEAQKSLNETMMEYIPFADKIQVFVKGYRDAKTAKDALTISTKLFGKALIATGIGAIIVLLGSLYAWLTKTQQGMDFVAKAGAAVSSVFKVVIERLATFAQGIGQLLSGNWSAAWDSLSKSVSGFGSELAKETASAWKNTEAMQALNREQALLEVNKAKSRAEIEKLKKAAEDQTASEQVRLAAATKAYQMEQSFLNQAIALQQRKIKLITEENAKKGITRTDEDLQRQYDAEIELANLQEESFTRQTELQNKVNELKKAGAQLSADIETEIVAQSKADQFAIVSESLEAEFNALGESLAKEVEARKKTSEQILQDRLRAMDLENQVVQDKIWTQFYEGQIGQEERDELIHQQQVKAIQDRLMTLALSGQTETAEYTKLYTDLAQLHYDYEQGKTKATEEEEAKRMAIQQQALQVTGQFFNAIAQMLSADENARKKNFKVIQALQAAEITAASIVEIQNIFKSFSALGPVGQVLAVLQAAAAGARAISALNRLRSVKFEQGGPVFGPSHGMGGIPFSVSGTPGYEMEGGEIILSKGVYADPTLRAAASMINVAGGGRAFAAGGPVNPLGSATVNPSVPGTPIAAAPVSDPALIREVQGLRADINSFQRNQKVILSLQKLKEEENRMKMVDLDTSI